MKKEDFKKIKKINVSQITDNRPFWEVLEEECNTLLKTRTMLKYLLLKYPNLSVVQAIKEFKSNYIIANEIAQV